MLKISTEEKGIDMYKKDRARVRFGMVVGLQELHEDKPKARELATELMMHSGYIGFFDIEDTQMRVYVFNEREDIDSVMAEMKHMDFRTVGKVHDPLFNRNGDLKRPHLRYAPRSTFYKELYK